MTTMRINFVDEDGVETEATIPAKWIICGTCNGDGAHSRHLGAITASERERDWSADEWEDYIAGGYDRECEDCNGTGKIKVPAKPNEEPAKSWLELEADREAERRADLRTLYMETGGAMGRW